MVWRGGSVLVGCERGVGFMYVFWDFVSGFFSLGTDSEVGKCGWGGVVCNWLGVWFWSVGWC